MLAYRLLQAKTRVSAWCRRSQPVVGQAAALSYVHLRRREPTPPSESYSRYAVRRL